MLKPRLIGIVLVRAGIAVQSLAFQRYLPLGRPEIAVEYLDRWGVDEIVLLEIDAGAQERALSPALVTRCTAACRTPLTVGGGIHDAAQAAALLAAGADKICLNSAIDAHPELIAELATQFGSQCIVGSLDVRREANGWRIWTQSGRQAGNRSLHEALDLYCNHGVGEILLNSIDRDGQKQGFDLALIAACAPRLSIPLIAAGGAGHPHHCKAALDAGANAVAAANMLHFTEHSVILIKRFLAMEGLSLRQDAPAAYPQATFLNSGRLAMAEASRLDAERFIKHPPDPA